MIEAKPIEVDYLLGWKWELPQINKPTIRYSVFSRLYENKDKSANIIFSNYKTINIEIKSNSEIEAINVATIKEIFY